MAGRWARLLVQCAASTLAVWLQFAALGPAQRLLFVWPLIAVQIWIALSDWRSVRSRGGQLLACWVGEFLGSQWLGMPLWIGCSYASVQVLEMSCVLGILYPHVLCLDDLTRCGNQAERDAQDGESIYKILINNLEDLIIFSSLDGARSFVSSAVHSITGWSEAEFAALGFLGAMHPEDREFAREIIDSLVVGEARQTFRHRFFCKDGSARWMESSIRGFTDSEPDRIAGYVATVRDISQHVESEDVWTSENASLASQNQQLSDLALKDELTGISNRRAFNLFLDYEFERHARSGTSLALMMIDVDHFKKYNDTLGHPAGDACLRRLAQALESCVKRTNDRVARFGGEEFAAILPETDREGAHKVARDLLDAVQDLAIEHPASPLGRVSVSVGIASLSPRHGLESTMLIQQADRALYESKRSGRNQVSVCGD